jgi:signal transduction histidine kinase
MWPVLGADERPVGVMIQVTETARFHQQATAMNQELLLSVVRQHELTAMEERLNAQLQLEITEHKRAEKALLRSEKLASVGRMASTIAHEINNPLETVGHAVYLALTDPGTSQQAKSYLDLAVKELERVTHITKQTLAFNREDKTPTLIDLRASVDSIVKLYAPRLKSRGITVVKRYAEVECIRAGGGEIQQVISNLLSNSMDATPNHGKIEFRVSRSIGSNGSRLVRFTIADTGSGIPPEQLKQIFEPFFTTKEIVGTGLGLWVTKQIVEKHGATIRVRSKLGRGTVFSIAFPIAEGTTQAG